MSATRASRSSSTGVQTERSRDRIMAAAAELARERGLDGATIAAVCQRSGLPASSVYWYFEDKDALFAEVIRTGFARWLASVPEWDPPGETSLEDGLRAILRPAARTLSAVPDFLGVGMQVVLERRDSHVRAREVFITVRAQVTQMISAWVIDFLTPQVTPRLAEELAQLVLAFSDGLLVASQLYPDWDPDEYIELFVSTLACATQAAAATATRAAS